MKVVVNPVGHRQRPGYLKVVVWVETGKNFRMWADEVLSFRLVDFTTVLNTKEHSIISFFIPSDAVEEAALIQLTWG